MSEYLQALGLFFLGAAIGFGVTQFFFWQPWVALAVGAAIVIVWGIVTVMY